MKYLKNRKKVNGKIHKPIVILFFIFYILFSFSLFAEDSAPKTGDSSTQMPLPDDNPNMIESIAILEHSLSTEMDRNARYRILLILGGLYELIGRVDAAQRSYELAAFIREGSSDFQAFYKSALLLIEMGELERAKFQTRTILSMSADKALGIKAKILLLYILSIEKNAREFESEYTSLQKEITETSMAFTSGETYTLYRALLLLGKNAEAERVRKTLLTENFSSIEAALAAEKDGASHALSGLNVTQYRAPFMFIEGFVVESPPDDGSEIERSPKELFIQTGLFSLEQNALDMAEALKIKGFASSITKVGKDDKQYFKVVVPIPGAEERQEILLKLKDAGFEAF